MYISFRTHRNVDMITIFREHLLCGAKKIAWFSNVHVYRGRKTNNMRRIVSFYYLQSLFIPPVWSPNVPCRHTCRCCIWRSPFSILDILPWTAVVKFTSQQQWPIEVIHNSCSCFSIISKCQIRRTKSPFIFAALQEITLMFWDLFENFC